MRILNFFFFQIFLEEGKRRDEASERENNYAIIGPLPESATRAAAGNSAQQAGPPQARPQDRQNVEFLTGMFALPELAVVIALSKHGWHMVCFPMALLYMKTFQS